MAAPAVLKIDIVADASKAGSVFGKVGDAAGKAGDNVEKSGSKFKSFAAGAARVAGTAALGGLVAVFKTGVGEQKDFLAGQAQLANGIKTTGNAAHVSVDGLENLASSIQNYSGQTDDSIVSSEKLLLTFTNIHNQTGKNNDIFNQATKMTADMAAKDGGDASKYAVQLGKALNDPTKGITALTRVGVTFTAQQQKQIKSMQKSGDTIGAQKVIMGELTKEFGGSAKAAGETLPGQMARAKRSFEDVSQSLVASFMPVLTQLADILLKDVMPAFQGVMGYLTSHHGVFLVVVAGIVALIGAMKTYAVVMKIVKFATAETTAANFKLAASFLANPIVLVIAAIVALGIALVILYKKSATFRNIVNGAFRAVAVAGKALWSAVQTAFDGIKKAIQVVIDFLLHSPIAAVLEGPWRIAFGAINALVTGGISGLLGYFRGLLTALTGILSKVWAIITSPFQRAFTWVKNNVSRLWNAFTSVAARVASYLSRVLAIITSPFSRAFIWVRSNVSRLWTAFAGIAGRIGSYLSGVASRITSPFSNGFTWVKSNVSRLWSAFASVAGKITTALSGVFNAIISPFQRAWDWINKNVISKITSAWNGVANAINSISVQFTIPSNAVTKALHLAGKGFKFDPPNVPTLARGGVVDRATLAIIGEGRSREIVAPEPMMRKIIREESGAGITNIYVSGALDPDAVARQIEKLLVNRSRRNAGVQRQSLTPRARA